MTVHTDTLWTTQEEDHARLQLAHAPAERSRAEVGALIDSLAGDQDRLWARHSWPEMRFDRHLGVGAVGGHGPIRYTVVAYEPGRWVRFRFTSPRGFDGFHEFTAHPRDQGGTDLRHLMAMRLRFPAWLTYPLLWRPLHDALLEDTLDRAERSLTGTIESPATWSPYVRCYGRSWPESRTGETLLDQLAEREQSCKKRSGKEMRAMIIGAGIGGLTAAIALRRSGIEATVFERAAELREVGAGILLAANAVKALGELGISEKVPRLGTAASVARIRSWRGDVLSDISVADLEKRVAAPSAAVHRADLQKVLLQELDEGNLRLGARFTGFRHDEEGVTAVFANGLEERGDVLIGADGLYSTVRTRLFGPEKPRYAGYTVWRAVVESDRELLPRGTGFESWGKGARFGCAHIGGGRVYWFATRNAPQGQKDGPAGTFTGPRATLTVLFDGWHRPVAELISETDERTIRRDDLYDREPLITPWDEGRVTLLGDAAHPMTPNLGQGACQTIEDAVVLARCLREDGEADMPSALRRYEDARRERTAWILRRSRVLGRVGQIKDPLLCRLRDAILKATPVEAQLRLFERVIDHEERPATRRSVRWFA